MFDIKVYEILSYGVIGLGFLLAVLAYRLLTREQRRDEPREPMIRAIYTFMAFSAVLCLLGIAGELLKLNSNNNNSAIRTPAQHWIKFTGIEFDSGVPATFYRVIMEVDGVEYSYPGHGVWHPNRPKFPDQRFPLKIGTHEPTVRCKIYYLLSGSNERHFATAERAKPIRHIPADEAQEVFTMVRGTRSPSRTATVRFNVFTD